MPMVALCARSYGIVNVFKILAKPGCVLRQNVRMQNMLLLLDPFKNSPAACCNTAICPEPSALFKNVVKNNYN